MASATSPRTSHRRVLTATTVGTTLEWFDFALYGALAGVVFPQVFFPTSTPAVAVIQSFATFGVGFLARPLGAVAFAKMADRAGRKKAMVVSLTMMGAVSLAIALLPGYHSIGVAAPAILVLLRFLQGFCLGGEASSAQVMALEYAPDGRRGLFGAMVNFGNPLGQVLVALFMLGTGALLGETVLNSWGWRIPFVIGALIAVVGYFIRRHVEESPVFVEASRIGAQARRPLRELFRTHRSTMIRLILVWLPNTALSYVVSTYALAYIVNSLGMSSSITFGLVLVLNLFGLALVPLGGALSDRFGRTRVLMATMTTSLIGSVALFPLLDTRNIPVMLLAMLVSQGSQFMSAGVLAAFFAEPFPTAVRYSGHATVYTLNNLIAGSTAPFAAALLLSSTGTTWSIVGVLVGLYVVGIAVLATLPETRWLPFADNHHVTTPTHPKSTAALAAVD
ncbi:Predicted arabinose efflux permease, MFS family [Micromonospora pallida]|uniref:Predicted arabinose efflux permease, MFS family n=1 Tax=Micromonospora pallida TaxID=145854 RepID=A0A1C6RX53_9ACTN|nr:MFS transporter [Micromonospora pallida]SCL21766.1 Predicted arabinose efflux permease, MFS family [Micromonospora pallida]